MLYIANEMIEIKNEPKKICIDKKAQVSTVKI